MGRRHCPQGVLHVHWEPSGNLDQGADSPVWRTPAKGILGQQRMGQWPSGTGQTQQLAPVTVTAHVEAAHLAEEDCSTPTLVCR